MRTNKIKQWLDKEVQHSAVRFASFIKGCYGFALGLMIILWTDHLYPASLQSELISLMGLIIMILGILVALRGYLSLSLFRIVRYFFKD